MTQRLISAHPLSLDTIRDVAGVSWKRLWQTRIGTGSESVLLADLRVPATIVGYFFEILFAKELALRYPGTWRGNQSGEEKDLVFLSDPSYSVEIKSSGQLGYRVYGNRSVGQRLQRMDLGKKEKSGYYLLVNFFEQALTLLRFGWIDETDWKPQKAPTGQMAGLSDEVYQHKLVIIHGDYELEAPVRLLRGVGP